jgi:Acetyltransferase (GNAT) domain
MTITNLTVFNKDTSTPRQQLEELCRKDPSVSIFLHPFWLDVVCKNGTWDVCISYDNAGAIDGVLVYYKVKLKGIITAIAMPELTPNAGIWLRLPSHKTNGIKRHSVYTNTKKIVENLVSQLPDVSIYCQHFHYALTDWQPFFWKNFRQTTHYSYILDNLDDLAAIYSDLKGSVRTDLKKAERLVSIENLAETTPADLSEFYEVVNLSFKKQGMKPFYSLEMLQELDAVLAQKGARKLFLARDTEGSCEIKNEELKIENEDLELKKGAIHGGVYIIIWNGTAHYIAGGSHPDLRQSGAMSLLIWRAIEWAAAQGCHYFDFEGSMIPQVETLFRAFGGKQKPFFRITKTRNRFYDLMTMFFPNYR